MITKQICIVSPDIIGPINNGGIGTHCYFLSKVLKKNGFDVSLLFTGPLQNKTHRFWEEFYGNMGITYYFLQTDKIGYEFHSNNTPFLDISYLTYEFLKTKKFDFIHFQEWLANGLVSIQAKETTSLFDNTTIAVTIHSSTQWQQEGMMSYSTQPLVDMKLKWAEEYCVKNCDIVISPSKHMFKWIHEKKWILTKNQAVLPYCYEKKQENKKTKVQNIDLSHLIFFGRLETRKGLEYFIDSVLNIKSIKKVSFVGKISLASELEADKYIAQNLNTIEFKIYDNLDTFQALKFIKEQNALVIIPSLLDNYPYTIIELIENNISFACSNTGGIPEMVDNKTVFDINDKFGLVKHISSINSDKLKNLKHKYDSKIANLNWVNFHHKSYKKNIKTDSKKPLVSICIPYYNYPEFLPCLLKSIQKINYDNYEVIVVNDGSTTQKAITTFNEMKDKYTKYRFFSKNNSGIGDTRNYAASKAMGDYLVFMDSDNLATKSMVEDFIFAIQKTNAHAITCYFDAFEDKFIGISPKQIIYKYIPLGACKEAGILENIYGDGNFIIQKQVFDRIGGFNTDKDTSWEDWEFLAKLSLEGFTQKIIPKSLFWYRHTKKGFSRNTNIYKNHKRILKCYNAYYQKEIQNMLSYYVLPNYYNVNKIKNQPLDKIINKFLPINSKRRKIVKKIIKGVMKK